MAERDPWLAILRANERKQGLHLSFAEVNRLARAPVVTEIALQAVPQHVTDEVEARGDWRHFWRNVDPYDSPIAERPTEAEKEDRAEVRRSLRAWRRVTRSLRA